MRTPDQLLSTITLPDLVDTSSHIGSILNEDRKRYLSRNPTAFVICPFERRNIPFSTITSHAKDE